MPFRDNLRRIRLEHFLSQAELARRSGVHALTITRLESGKTSPSTRTVRALADALGVSPGELATPTEVAEADLQQRRRQQATGRTDGHSGTAATLSSDPTPRPRKRT